MQLDQGAVGLREQATKFDGLSPADVLGGLRAAWSGRPVRIEGENASPSPDRLVPRQPVMEPALVLRPASASMAIAISRPCHGCIVSPRPTSRGVARQG